MLDDKTEKYVNTKFLVTLKKTAMKPSICYMVHAEDRTLSQNDFRGHFVYSVVRMVWCVAINIQYEPLTASYFRHPTGTPRD
jgi:hypothetical protein